MKSNLKLYTSFVSPVNVPNLIKNDYLPIFIIRSIRGSKLIGEFEGTAIHFPQLAPSRELLWSVRDGKIDRLEFNKKYTIEMSRLNLFETIKKLEYLAKISNAKGVVLLGYGSDPDKCHRSVLSNILNGLGIMADVEEIKWEKKPI